MTHFPRTYVLELTRQCNNKCAYCYNIWRAPDFSSKKARPREMSTDEIKEIIDKLQREAQVAMIALSGGEPLLRSDIGEIISFIRSRSIPVLLICNGTLLTEEMVNATMDGVMFELPLLSCRKEVHDEMVGRVGAWDAVIDGIMNVHASAKRLSVVFVATRLNYTDLYATARLAMMLGANELLYKRVNVGASNYRFKEELFLTPTMIEENLHTLDYVASRFDFPVHADVVIEPCVVDIRKFTHVQFGWCHLAGEHSSFAVDPEGNVRVCEHSPVIIGNLQRDHLADICRHPYIHSFKNIWPIECRDCESDMKNLCKGGCKAAAEQIYGTMEHVDPFVRENR